MKRTWFIKQSKIFSIFFLLLFLVWCESSPEMQTITFDNLQMEIPKDFQKVAPGLVENKQIINKVIASYKQKQEWFSPNLIVTKSSLAQELDFEQFRTANTNKLKKFMVGYQPWEKELIAFDCGQERIQGIFVTFQVDNNYYGKKEHYALAQYQFVMNQKWYIISTAYLDKEQQMNLKKWIKTLQCKNR